MKIEKEKRKVNIVCNDGSWIKGFIHINPGERTSDFINDSREIFIVITSVEFYIGKAQTFKVPPKPADKTNTILLNKSVIKWLEEA